MKETTIVLNTIDSVPGEVLERTRSHKIWKQENGLLFGEFVNQFIEEFAVKLTFTGLKPFTKFELRFLGAETRTEQKKANSAGILEFKAEISAGGRMDLQETV